MVVLYCQHCGLSQIAGPVEAVRPCAACAGRHFAARHPASCDRDWRWPGYSAHDCELLKECGIATVDARYGAVAATGSGGVWWLVVDLQRDPAGTRGLAVVGQFGPYLRDAEGSARALADTLNHRDVCA